MCNDNKQNYCRIFIVTWYLYQQRLLYNWMWIAPHGHICTNINSDGRECYNMVIPKCLISSNTFWNIPCHIFGGSMILLHKFTFSNTFLQNASSFLNQSILEYNVMHVMIYPCTEQSYLLLNIQLSWRAASHIHVVFGAGWLDMHLLTITGYLLNWPYLQLSVWYLLSRIWKWYCISNISYQRSWFLNQFTILIYIFEGTSQFCCHCCAIWQWMKR